MGLVTDLIPPLAVLGLFSNEGELRDHIADRLELIEPDLRLLQKEYTLRNPDGSGGRIDILAEDPLGHVLCIEIKRSENSERGTLNELSKYVTLLVAQERVPKEMIRCVVVSTHWKELLLPLSYFARSTGVDVTALKAVRDGEGVTLVPVKLIEFSFLPQLSPDMDLIWFDTAEPRAQTIEIVRARASRLPFVRMALLSFDPKGTEFNHFPLVICGWRINDGYQEKIEAVIGDPIGHNHPYAAPGWEPETDAMEWIARITRDEVPEYSASWSQGTSEKVASLLPNYELASIERIGDWPSSNVINDNARILDAVLATSPRGGMGRPNRYRFSTTAKPSVASSWNASLSAFLEFISFEPEWREQAEAFLGEPIDRDDTVQFEAADFRHLVYSIHQARFHEEASLGWFEIAILKGDKVLRGIRGEYTWDGVTCPPSAAAAIDEIYGDLVWARLAINSAVDEGRYERAHPLHGFMPAFAWLKDGMATFSEPGFRRSIRDFTAANPEYSEAISAELNSIGHLPTTPSY